MFAHCACIFEIIQPRCEGETRFRWLCQPFLYSHSSSNVLEVEAVVSLVTNHVVVRGSYRSLTLVIYGKAAEDLGQFNIEVDLDSTLTNTVSCIEGKLEDLPLALHLINVTIEDLIFMPKALSLEVHVSDISVEVKQLLDLTFKVLQLSNRGNVIDKVISMIVSAASSCATHSCYCPDISQKQSLSHFDYTEIRNELFDMYNSLHNESGKLSSESVGDRMLFAYEADLATSKQLMDILQKYIHFDRASGIFGRFQSESCFHFVNGGGMEQLRYIIIHDVQNSHAITLMVLGVVEQAMRHSIGCEGFLGWWPCEDESIPSGTSVDYNEFFELLLQKQPHDVASLATHILHRLRFMRLLPDTSQQVLLQKMINSHAPLEDPSPLACTSRLLLLGETGVLSYKSTCSLITSSNCWFSNWDIDSYLLFLLMECFCLESCYRSGEGILSFVNCTVMIYLMVSNGNAVELNLPPPPPELSTNVILALRGSDGFNFFGCVFPLPASLLVSSVVVVNCVMFWVQVNAIDRLLTSGAHSEEILWVLWELCALSGSHCGRQALLALGHFPVVFSYFLLRAIGWKKGRVDASIVYHSKGATGLLQYIALLASGGDPHMASTSILLADTMDVENMVGDSSTNSDSNLIENLLEKPISKNSYRAAVLCDSSVAQMTTAFRILAFISENSAVATALYDEGAVMVIHVVLIDFRLMLERSSNNYSGLVKEGRDQLCHYYGSILKDSGNIEQDREASLLEFLWFPHQILEEIFIGARQGWIVCPIFGSEVDIGLGWEGGSFDYLVDEGTEGNSTSDLLLEHTREQGLVDLVIPSLVLLVNLLQKLQMSTRLAFSAADLSSPYPCSALGLEAACHLLVSALACWPVYGRTLGLFSCLVDSHHATSLLALGPKEAWCLLCLLNDLLPEEGFWLWKNGMPMLSALRTLAVGSLLGPQKERQIGLYLQPEHLERVLSQLTPQLGKIGQIILHCAVSTLVVMQDMLRVFIICIACLNADHACLLLRPIISWVRDQTSVLSSLPDTDAYKVYRLLDFLSILLEHPRAKPLLLKEGAFQMLIKVLERRIAVADSDEKQFCDNRNIDKCGFPQLTWCAPIFKSSSLINNSRKAVQALGIYDRLWLTCLQYFLVILRHNYENLMTEYRSRIMSYLLKFCKYVPSYYRYRMTY
ncbi:hypothetical protein RHSIM_Rhsim04G0136900 [Rhododendron simsii]|uniref:Uncharacterized protein n=1 Tax=Rhododendron simsii TaxID=118357 RepID=A0A834H086_RHOSS|nr:hypothetical protein RHSIM_Rhsim04G0136900 [Rhododendron simsii]